jgi:rubrerythrin
MAAVGGIVAGRWGRLLEALRPDARAALLAALERDYAEEVVAARRMAEDAERLHADFLRRKLEHVAASEREHARALREAIVRLGGVAPGPVAPPAGPRLGPTFQRLLEDLEDEKRDSAEYLRAAALARRAGAEDVEALLRRIRSDEERHTRELVDILGRIDPNA